VPFRPRSVTIHPATQSKFDDLGRDALKREPPAQAIWKALGTSVLRIKADGQWGEVIPPSSIPRAFSERYGLTNLYCVDLPSFHRMFYTVGDRDIVIIELIDHREYDRLMRHSG
jgi:hypothetical protein